MEEMRRACFEYLRLGGSMSAGPIALLGGLETNPLTLVSHFFSVAMFGVTRLMTPLPTPASLLKSANLLKGAVKIISPDRGGRGSCACSCRAGSGRSGGGSEKRKGERSRSVDLSF